MEIKSMQLFYVVTYLVIGIVLSFLGKLSFDTLWLTFVVCTHFGVMVMEGKNFRSKPYPQA